MYKTHQILVNTRSAPLYFLQPFDMEKQKLTNKDVVLFYPWFNSYFPLFRIWLSYLVGLLP